MSTSYGLEWKSNSADSRHREGNLGLQGRGRFRFCKADPIRTRARRPALISLTGPRVVSLADRGPFREAGDTSIWISSVRLDVGQELNVRPKNFGFVSGASAMANGARH